MDYHIIEHILTWKFTEHRIEFYNDAIDDNYFIDNLKPYAKSVDVTHLDRHIGYDFYRIFTLNIVWN